MIKTPSTTIYQPLLSKCLGQVQHNGKTRREPQERDYISTVHDSQGLSSLVRDKKYLYETLKHPDKKMESGYCYLHNRKGGEWELSSHGRLPEEVKMRMYKGIVWVCVRVWGWLGLVKGDICDDAIPPLCSFLDRIGNQSKYNVTRCPFKYWDKFGQDKLVLVSFRVGDKRYQGSNKISIFESC